MIEVGTYSGEVAAAEKWVNAVVRQLSLRISGVRVCRGVQIRRSWTLTQGRSTRGRHKGGVDGRSERKAFGGIIWGHEVQMKGLVVVSELDPSSVDKGNLDVIVLAPWSGGRHGGRKKAS